RPPFPTRRSSDLHRDCGGSHVASSCRYIDRALGSPIVQTLFENSDALAEYKGVVESIVPPHRQIHRSMLSSTRWRRCLARPRKDEHRLSVGVDALRHPSKLLSGLLDELDTAVLVFELRAVVCRVSDAFPERHQVFAGK